MNDSFFYSYHVKIACQARNNFKVQRINCVFLLIYCHMSCVIIRDYIIIYLLMSFSLDFHTEKIFSNVWHFNIIGLKLGHDVFVLPVSPEPCQTSSFFDFLVKIVLSCYLIRHIYQTFTYIDKIYYIN